jgi:hypothetical protein
MYPFGAVGAENKMSKFSAIRRERRAQTEDEDEDLTLHPAFLDFEVAVCNRQKSMMRRRRPTKLRNKEMGSEPTFYPSLHPLHVDGEVESQPGSRWGQPAGKPR